MKRLLLIAALCLSLVLLGSFAKAEGLGHHCEGDACPVCALIQMVEGNTADDAALSDAALAVGFPVLSAIVLLGCVNDSRVWSPVHSHIRIDS